MLLHQLTTFTLKVIVKIHGLLYYPPLWKILGISLLISLFLLFISKTLKGKKLTVFMIILLFVFIFYFNFLTSLLFIGLLFSSMLIGSKFFQLKSKIASLLVGFISQIQIYILFSLIISPAVALYILEFIFALSLIYKYKVNLSIINNSLKDIQKGFSTFHFLDFFILTFSFFIGSLPQTHWDSVMANLYNAKWYILNNSFSPITESISSLFPQNAIGYYSLFYQIGNFKGFEIAFLLPLLLLIVILKSFINKLEINSNFQLLLYGLLFTPIVIFQSSSGYYDLFLMVVLLGSLYLLYFQPHKNPIINSLLSSFLIGFAAAIKYFPLLFLMLPILYYWIFDKKSSKNKFLFSLFMLLIGMLPLFIWMIRAYVVTGSPVFPFFQNIFPTPNFWPQNSFLENNFMIQTPLSALKWLIGGHFVYPVLTFFKTSDFLEATNWYPGFIYIFIMVLQVIVLKYLVINIIKKKLNKLEFFYLYSFFAYFGMGIIARYYRYVWPYQFIFSLFLILFLYNYWKTKLAKSKVILFIGIFIIFFNALSIFHYYRFFPLELKMLFQPNYYLLAKDTDPASFLNRTADSSAVVLDASKYNLPRVHFKNKVYQCSWYWIGLDKKIQVASKDKQYANDLLSKFRYIIVNNPINDKDYTSSCKNIILQNIAGMNQIYKNQYYLIYENK